jgi:lactoylglutathione lyase
VEYKLTVVRVFVTDWTRALRFYLDTLGMTATHRSDDWGWAQLATGEGQLAIERVDASDDEGRALVGRFIGVSLQVPDIFATYDTLVARGVEFLGAPEKQPWGGVLAHLRGPDGNVLTLLSSAL